MRIHHRSFARRNPAAGEPSRQGDGYGDQPDPAEVLSDQWGSARVELLAALEGAILVEPVWPDVLKARIALASNGARPQK